MEQLKAHATHIVSGPPTSCQAAECNTCLDEYCDARAAAHKKRRREVYADGNDE